MSDTVIPQIIGPWMPERAEKKRITSHQATQIIEKCNLHNRAHVQATIDKVMNDLKAGKWEVNGETIIFAHTGVLLDGQNRLLGCIEANLPLTTWVVFGMDPEAFKTIDRGKSRNVASDLSIAGEENCTALAAVLQILAAYFDGMRNQKLVNSAYDYLAVQAVLKEHPDIRKSVAFASSNKNKIMCPPRIIGAVHYLAGYQAAPRVIETRDEFFARLADGANLTVGNPIHTLREKLFSMARDSNARVKKGMGKLAAQVYIQCVVRAWNSYLSGRRIGKIQLVYTDYANTQLADLPDVKNGYKMHLDRADQKLEEMAQTGAQV